MPRPKLQMRGTESIFSLSMPSESKPGMELKMPPKPNRVPESMTAKVYAAVRREILSCQIIPGEELSEGELATRFKMSKTPVREALAKLRAEGLVKIFPRRGYQVAPVTFQDMNELFEIRSMLEGRAAELASQRITREDIGQLSTLADIIYDRAEHLSIRRFVQTNRDFHEGIAVASGNRRLHGMILQVLDELQRFFHLGAQLRDVGNETNDYHRQIIAGLTRRDASQARSSIMEDIASTQRGLLVALTKQTSSVMEITPRMLSGKSSRKTG